MARAPGEIARRMRKLRALGVAVSLAIGVVAGVKAATAPEAQVRPLQGDARQQVMRVLANDEARRRVTAKREFPGDRWSQGDAFHATESEIVRGQASLHGVALESVLDVLDDDLRARRVPDRQAGSPPCKPRPQYD